MGQAQNRTRATDASVEEFLQNLEPQRRKAEATELDRLFREMTGWKPRMWGPSIVGYGKYHYRYESGREGEFMATGFSPRKTRHSVYIMPGCARYTDILERLGKHSIGKPCLYINKLSDVDMKALAELIDQGLRDLGREYAVKAT